MEACWEAVNEVRSAVHSYIDAYKKAKSVNVLKEIEKMDTF